MENNGKQLTAVPSEVPDSTSEEMVDKHWKRDQTFDLQLKGS